MEKKIILIDGELEYIFHQELTDKGLVSKLDYSKSQCWSEHIRETTALEAIDDGNGIKFKNKIGKEVDYHHAIQLSILLKELAGSDLDIEVINYKK